ncbi:MAG: hypothetical protein KKB95_09745 [Gammaproteobacteria bacterium]|nr:hypothetical protein [Gammaproteobacteria bacterium]MBU1505843.1 hypothetical protein [Gammaproteobacteria bacterium]MBU2119531.1 hypothetical protein [Gammaproteobacteria bacterium]MBU2172563.1 hypothetical protein [Gammaproteobacteria bacterium]MBU2202021.1 hypothetical protein [Gammaproteobacteria bacterium]
MRQSDAARVAHVTPPRRYRMVQMADIAVLVGVVAFQCNPAKAAEQLVLSATGKDGMFLDKPSCWVTLQVNNPTSDEVTLFATELRAADSVTGKALETVSLPVVGIVGGKLAPQSVSKPWPLNVQETRCANVAVRFSKLSCVVGGRKCSSIAVAHKGVASMVAPVQ